MELQFPFLLPIFTIFLAFLFFLVFKTSKGRNRTSKTPPGPWKLPLIGSMHHLAGSMPHRALRALSRRYGPMMHLQLGEISAIVISSPKMAKEVMKTHDIDFANRPALLAANIIGYDSKNIAFAPYGNYWRQMRKICILELLSAKNVRSFFSIRDDEVLKLVESIKSNCGSPINFSKHIFSLTSAVVCRATFGQRCEDEDALISLIKEGNTMAGGFDVSDLFPSHTFLHVLSRVKPKLVSLHRKIDNILEKIIKQHQEKIKKSNPVEARDDDEDLLDVLLRLQGSNELDFPITTKNVKAVILDMFAAGTDTSSSTVEWVMSELIKNQKVMEKAQAEMRNALKGKKTIHETDVKGLEYLKLVIRETLRLHPPLPLLLPRECRNQCEIEGYTIPVKTKVIVNAWAIGRDPEYWNDDADKFLPERFYDKHVDFNGIDFEFIPFGAGRRMCPGMSFGIANVELPLAQLLYHFNWKLPDGMSPEDLDMVETVGATAGRKKHLYLVATPYDEPSLG